MSTPDVDESEWPRPPQPPLPGGTVTFLLTDIESSSLHWEERPDAMRVALRRHDQIVFDVINGHDGVVVRHNGDGVNAAFGSTIAAAEAAIELQRRFQTDDWGGVDRLRVRAGIHVGDIEPAGDDYYGPPINRAARVMDVANGDQISVSGEVAALLADRWPTRDVGDLRLKGVGTMRILFLEPDGLRNDDRPPRGVASVASAPLPAETSPLIGREAEVDELSALLDDRRLVTIAGLGGLGKTRLAIAAARAVEDRFADGVAYCDLTGVGSETEVIAAIAHTAGARPQPGLDLMSSLRQFVAGRDMLLVLDNCEHVIDEARRAVEGILQVDGPRVLGTSREPLLLRGEQHYPIRPLASVEDAVDLFVLRLRERDPRFHLDDAAAAIAGEICVVLDGIPLAIELAAARARVLSLDAVLDRLDDRFRELRGGGLPTLLATVEWSYEQLSVEERHVFEQLAVFAGGATLDAAVSVCRGPDGEVLDVDTLLDILSVLADKALVSSDRSGTDVRFAMLETLRAFGAERCTDPGVADRHAAYFVELAAFVGRELCGPREAEIWDAMDRDWPNLRAAEAHAIRTGDLEAAAELVCPIGWYVTFAMRMEAFGWVDRILEELATLGRTADRSAELYALSAIGQYLTAGDGVGELAQRSLDLDIADPTALARTAIAGLALNNTFDTEVSERVTQEMRHHADPADTLPFIVSVALRTFHLVLRDPNAEALPFARQAMEIAEKSESPSALGIASWAWGLANVGIDPTIPLSSLESGLEHTRSLSRQHLMGHLIDGVVVHLLVVLGDQANALARCRAAVRLAMESHYLLGTSHLLAATAAVLARAGRIDAAGALVGSMAAHGHAPRRDIRRVVQECLGDRYDELVEEGRSLSIIDAGHLAIREIDAVMAAPEGGSPGAP